MNSVLPLVLGTLEELGVVTDTISSNVFFERQKTGIKQVGWMLKR